MAEDAIIKIAASGDTGAALKGLKEITAEATLLKQTANEAGVAMDAALGTAQKHMADAAKAMQQMQTAKVAGDWQKAAQEAAVYQKNIAAVDKATKGVDDTSKKARTSAGELAHVAMAPLEHGVKAVEKAIHQVEAAAEHSRQALRAVFNPLTALGTGMFGGIASLFGVGFIIKQTEDWDKAVAHLTYTMNGNAEVASKWAAVADQFGIDQDQMAQSMSHLSMMVDKNNVSFKTMGISVANTDGSLKTLDALLSESANYFRAHAGASNEAALARDLFGRSGDQLLPILRAEPAVVNQIVDAYRKLGLIETPEMLRKNRELEMQMDAFGTTIKGVAVSIGHELLPLLTALATSFGNFIVEKLPMLVAWLKEAVRWILSFAEGLGWLTGTVDSTMAAINDQISAFQTVGSVMDTTAGQAASLKDEQQALQDQTKAATDAINNQIQALQDEAKAFDENIQDQIKALEQAGQQESFQDQLTKLNQKKAEDANKIAKLRSDYQHALDIGDLDLAQQINDQLTQALQDQQNNENDITRATADEERRQKIAALQETQKQHQDETASMIENLRKQEKAIQDAAALAARAMADAGMQMEQGIANGLAPIPGLAATAGTKAGENFLTSVDKNAEQLGEHVKAWFTKVMHDKGVLGVLESAGEAAGRAMAKGFVDAAGSIIGDWWNSIWQGLGDAWAQGEGVDNQGSAADQAFKRQYGFYPWEVDPLTGKTYGHEAGYAGYALGGTVPGPTGAPRMILAHGGEEIRNRSQQIQDQNSNSRPINVTINVNGANDPRETARLVADKLNHALGLL